MKKISIRSGRQSSDYNGSSFACIIRFFDKSLQKKKTADVKPAQTVKEWAGNVLPVFITGSHEA